MRVNPGKLVIMQRNVMSISRPWKKVANHAFVGCVYMFVLMGSKFEVPEELQSEKLFIWKAITIASSRGIRPKALSEGLIPCD